MLKIKELLKKKQVWIYASRTYGVVLIIGILVAIAIPMYQNSTSSARDQDLQGQCSNNIQCS